MSNHPIEALMTTTMENLKQMVDVNTIVGDPVETKDGTVIIPISQVSLGFASGGAEYGKKKHRQESIDTDSKNEQAKGYPFGGGSGAGVSVRPSAFIVVGHGQMKLLPVDNGSNVVNNFLDLIPFIAEHLHNKITTKKTKTVVKKEKYKVDEHDREHDHDRHHERERDYDDYDRD
ncbi:GerW family sporulation protein [Clostridiaceae bacterium M8S5]|nr:GerW family sporulation protein [Clostridiaceae bacterium M8S5]